jgi:hypothetical protein
MENCAENYVVDLLGSENVYWDALLIQEGPESDKIGAKMINGARVIYSIQESQDPGTARGVYYYTDDGRKPKCRSMPTMRE